MRAEATSERVARSAVGRVRPLTFADGKRVAEIERRAFLDPWPRYALETEIENPQARALGIETNGELVGYVICWVVLDQAHIGKIAVLPEFRRQGLGDRLLTHLLEALNQQGVREIHLEVRRSSQAAQKLYKKHGFVVTGVRKNYYSKQREDALVMSLLLKEGIRYGLV